ncbi:restriction endonuclease subunit S [Methanobrevibacter cuticularis]|uniref:restriction endonuclease subunit S n=1 Tax=Methanobrevibacter cuticularis TaxID=47311 RepID=UPI00082E939D|nr:restriction endonuclease subunit S [Methanobrevibacter cuticularis]
MNLSWKKVKAKDIIDFNPRESLSKNSIAKKVSMDKINPYSKEITDFEVSEFKGGTKFRNGDTLMARITPCLENGKTSQVNILDEGEIGFGSTEFIVLREKENKSDKDYIYYLSVSDLFRDPAIKSMVGTSGRQRVQKDVLENLEFYAPPLEEQIKIGKFLSNFDKKIELIKQINHNLQFT